MKSTEVNVDSSESSAEVSTVEETTSSSDTASATDAEGNKLSEDGVATVTSDSRASASSSESTPATTAGKAAKELHSIRLDDRSSLNYKVQASGSAGRNNRIDDIEGTGRPLTTKPSRKKKQVDPMDTQQQHQRPKTTYSRAQGSGGPPPHQFSLKDLEDMSEEDLVRLIQQDPELHAAAVKAAEQERGAHRSSSPTGRRSGRDRSSSNRKRDSDSSSYQRQRPGRYSGGGVSNDRSIKDNVSLPGLLVQWTLVLVLLGFLGFQLRNMLVQPTASRGASGSVKRGSVGPRSGGKHQKKQKHNKKQPKQGSNAKPSDIDADNAILDVLSAEPTGTARTKDTLSMTNKKPIKKKKQAKENASTTAGSKQRLLQTDLASTDGSSGAQEMEAADKFIIPVENQPTADEVPLSLEQQEDSGSWQTVSKSKLVNKATASLDTTTEAVSPIADNEKLVDTTASVENAVVYEQLTTAPEPEEEYPSEKDVEVVGNGGASKSSNNEKKINVKETTNKPKTAGGKKKKKTKQPPVVSAVKESTLLEPLPSTEDDAKLALTLQMEEENLARAKTSEERSVEEVWEEVPKKKKAAAMNAITS